MTWRKLSAKLCPPSERPAPAGAEPPAEDGRGPGGTFTLTNHGVSGSLLATPIILQPQCAILGVGAIPKRVVVIDDAIAIRPMDYLTLTFDHRILEGARADAFLAKVIESLNKPGF